MKNNSPSKKVIAFAIISLGIVGSLFAYKYLKDHPGIFPYIDSGSNNTDSNVAGDANTAPPLQDLSYEATSSVTESPADYSNKIDSTIDTNANDTGANSSSTPDKPLTSTDVLAETLFSKYMALKSASPDGTISDSDQTDLVNNLASSAQNDFTFVQYNRNGLQVFSGEEKEKLRFYASSFATLQTNFLNDLQDNKAAIEKNMSVASKLYANLATSLYALEVPQAISTEHLIIVNNLSIASAAFEAFAKFKSDPLPSSTAVNAYKQASALQDVALSKIAEYLRKNDIIFTPDEVGYFWNDF